MIFCVRVDDFAFDIMHTILDSIFKNLLNMYQFIILINNIKSLQN